MFQPSKYQVAIYDWVKNAEPGKNLIVQALAGSGKSSTQRGALDYIPKDQSVLIMAFNKAIAEDMKTKVRFGVDVRTFNSMGSGIVSKFFGRAKLDTWKISKIFDGMVNDEKLSRKCGYAVSKTVSLMKAYMGSIEFFEMLDKHEINIPDKIDDQQFKDWCQTVLASCKAITKIIDFDDQVWLPSVHDLPAPQYDWVMVDEGQDMNRMRMALAKKCIRPGGHLMVVGDRHQAIYGFTGADPESMDNIKEEFNCDELPLSICYRCPKSVIEAAKAIVPEIEAADNASTGEVSEISHKDFKLKAAKGEYVLCRTTAPLVSNCLEFIRNGKRAQVKGREIGDQLEAIIDELGTPYTTCKDAMFALEQYELNQVEKLSKGRGSEAKIQNLQDKCETIKVLMEEANTLGDVKRKISEIFSDKIDPNEFITFMTAHKSKGLEAKVVYILKPELMPHPNAKQEWQMIQEMNLKYVAITRSMDKLYWVV